MNDPKPIGASDIVSSMMATGDKRQAEGQQKKAGVSHEMLCYISMLFLALRAALTLFLCLKKLAKGYSYNVHKLLGNYG